MIRFKYRSLAFQVFHYVWRYSLQDFSKLSSDLKLPNVYYFAILEASSVIKVVFSISIVVVCVEIMRAILNWRAEKVKNELK